MQKMKVRTLTKVLTDAGELDMRMTVSGLYCSLHNCRQLFKMTKRAYPQSCHVH